MKTWNEGVTVERFRDHRFHKASLNLLASIGEIAAGYAEAELRLSVRQCFYLCVVRTLIENSESEYQKIIRLLTDAREAGLFDWAAIEDRGREVVMRHAGDRPPKSWRRRRLPTMRIDGSSRTPVVVLEKAALAGVVGPTCEDLDVPLLAARGYSSCTLFYEIAKTRICPALEAGQDVVVLHLADHDASGLDMTRDLRDRLSLYARQAVAVRRVALNMDQIEAFQPPPNPAKQTDKRFQAYRREHGDQCWELDALPPEELARLTREATEEHIDWPQWGASTAVIEERQASLRKLVGVWEGSREPR